MGGTLSLSLSRAVAGLQDDEQNHEGGERQRSHDVQKRLHDVISHAVHPLPPQDQRDTVWFRPAAIFARPGMPAETLTSSQRTDQRRF